MAAAALSSSRRSLHTLHRHLLLRPCPAPAAALRAPSAPAPRHFPSPSAASRFFTTAHPEARLPRHNLLAPQQQSTALRRLVGGFRSFSSGRSKQAPLGQGVKGLGRPVEAAKSAASRYREAVGLQVEAFWRRNYMLLVGAGGVVVCIALWRVMFGIASTFVGLSEGMAKYGFLALATAMVAFAGMYARARFSINPDKVYRIAMTKLNTSAAILEVMGAPLTGTDVRAYVMSGGGPKLKDFKFKVGGKRCFLIFPIKGSERKGLVSVEVKKKKGEYDMKLLAVDIPMATGPDQRLFLVGDEQEYKVGGGLISELRDPIVKAMAAEKEFDYLDEREDEEDERREREEAEEEAAEALRREEDRLREEAKERHRREAELEKAS
ncbi:uncharacterized protein LOC100828088 [Brachypodium distachyon]|uniref:Uncharacterized protein n=1 Tax=Brachypodium distachyon TaxID=15368 RepID=I1HCD1_BRADI|nr:uncharacterized protein LOC100828088 [Brachypodium distachyon]KQK02868.1 hypothetical protein BRADI_2g04190v3 [Brachypodium distachyon]|eukprot:XP_003569192.1 uncharacterized protein LOC100828088 [Brachypodium distachyon]